MDDDKIFTQEKENKRKEEDPLLDAGYGVNAFYIMVGRVFKGMCCLTLFNTVPIVIITSMQGQKYTDFELIDRLQLGIGNLGGSTVQCVHHLVDSS